MRNLLATLALGSLLAGAVVLDAQDREHRNSDQQGQGQRYYDKTGRDWHQWNDNENRAYQHYLQEHRKKDHEFAHASNRERNEYFRWRHSHPDSDL